MLRALRHRNYRLFFAGQSLSMIGTWVTRIATSWLVYRLSGSEFLLGLSAFCGQIPILLLSPFAGVLCDRWNKRRVMLVTQLLSLLQSAALAGLAFGGFATVGGVLFLQLFQGLVNAFEVPARQSFVARMVVDKADLPNAIALNSSLVNASRIIGPSLGGLLLASVGEGWCFALDTASYGFVLASLLAMRLEPEVASARGGVLADLKAGFRFVTGFAPVRILLTNLALVSVLGLPYLSLLPVVASHVLHGGPQALGVLMTAQGMGALAGALYLASRPSVLGLSLLIVRATVLFGLALIAFSLSHSLVASAALLVVVGAGFMIMIASTNTIVQTIVEEDMRARVMAYYAMAVLGTAPLGSLLGGILAARVGAAEAILGGGMASLLVAAWFARQRGSLRAGLRPIYVRQGLL